jgi:hypothetical protein
MLSAFGVERPLAPVGWWPGSAGWWRSGAERLAGRVAVAEGASGLELDQLVDALGSGVRDPSELRLAAPGLVDAQMRRRDVAR